jgi:hypothetical protein
MDKKSAAKYNEPLVISKGDYVPRVSKVKVKQLSATVRARLEVEIELSRCGNEESDAAFRFNAVRRKALLAILAESDSPLSASLRADAASVAGGIKDKKIQSAVRKIALDEKEDLETRLNAVSSFINLAGSEASKDIDLILSSKDLQVRRTGYVSALRSRVPEHVAVASEKFKQQRNNRIKNIITRKIPTFQGDTTKPAN